MNANELMIGDWVRHANGTPMQVEKIDYRGFACGIPHCWDYNNIYEPIPITKELLDKNGFALDDGMYTNDVMTLHDDKKFIRTKNAWSVGAFENECCRIAHCELTYLHELQHLLRICKIDFEWKV